MANKEILVAVDGSTRSQKLVDVSTGLAKDLGAGVHVLYVSPQSPVPEEFRTYAELEDVNPEGYNDAVGQAIVNKLERGTDSEGIKWESDVESGNPASTIVRYASKPEVLMVVVGLRGLHGVGRVRSLGSVARRVIENCPVPVVVVPT